MRLCGFRAQIQERFALFPAAADLERREELVRAGFAERKKKRQMKKERKLEYTTLGELKMRIFKGILHSV